MKNCFHLTVGASAFRKLTFLLFILSDSLAWGQKGGYILEKNYTGIDFDTVQLNYAFEALYNKLTPADQMNFKIYDLAFYRIGQQLLSSSGQSMTTFIDSLASGNTNFLAIYTVWGTDQYVSDVFIQGKLPITLPVFNAYGNNRIFELANQNLIKEFEGITKNINNVRLLQRDIILKLIEIL